MSALAAKASCVWSVMESISKSLQLASDVNDGE